MSRAPASPSKRRRSERPPPPQPYNSVDAVAYASAEGEWIHGVRTSTRKGRESVLKVLEATKGVLISHGYAGLTLRLVGERADIAHSNVQYYFPTKERLIESFMMYVSEAYREDIRELFDSSPNEPLERFNRYVRFYIDDNRTEAVTVIFAELRAMSQRSDFILVALDRMYIRYRTQVETLLAAINPDLPTEALALRAALIISLIDGLMIFIGGKNDRHAALADLGAEAERQILRIAASPA